MESILSVKSDFLFKLLFGDVRNMEILANFLSAVLEMPHEEMEDLQLLDTVLKKEYEDDKIGILDVNLKLRSGLTINIEIQVLNKKDFEKRAVFYTSKLLAGQLSEGDFYVKLNRVISIYIIDFNLFPYEKYHSKFWFMEETEGTKLTEIARIDFLELKKAKASPNADMKRLWMDFLNAESEEELKMLAEKQKEFEKPVSEVIRLSSNSMVRAEYEARQKEIRDRMAEIALGEERGFERGIAENNESVAIKMKRIGIPYSQIALCTGYSVEEIEKL